MVVRRSKPLLGGSLKSRVIKRTKVNSRSSGTGSNPTFSRLTVVWVQNNGVPFDTTGFFARLSRGSTLVSTARFDRFGVVRFNNIRTLTNVPFTLRLFNNNGILFRTRTIPAGVEVFAVIG
ncbi:hypothetical protein [Cohnella cholangitidis]|uniref:Uncharacterized protein n=1 Tax=Cohnella cholangitidis TaxID=2598458 RepID=A0A7G5BVQ9_9BACL|nr:hypothetical protein [Cohnella cholangitidis]QMV41043.1 hypothetical protein FPL14_07455 [Cohnella cholangitidis]